MSMFMLLLSDNPSDYAELSPAELQAIVARYSAWAQELGAQGKLRGGEKLRDEGGKIVRREGGALVVRDGPYAELREIVSGYFLIDAADYDEAVAIARSCPHADSSGHIAVREIEVTGGA
ncbi:YciI family protein [Gemmatimonas phototrophica]|uniref:Transcription initiation protein n=1 Tax=Gemmatimonas phototrophica TaxID=1379270 RepID=A0A143BLH0_9BACT|nr:YciI family protein [Gemmatimonas phototrophica]AMW05887.1 transcription initiation protein [Gemmatimonas phototrophica]